MKTIQLTKPQTENRLCRTVQIDELIEPLANIIAHPDRNRLIRDFFSSEDERRKEEVRVATLNAKPLRRWRVISLYNNQTA